ncbi:sigma-70 family RNA polymerase sigma factor [Flavonifractor sp. HCP28S3_F3]|uniref:sigma-70 family RNA polymerase sigma factor n=1 Tax=Flavonifractor sp. HCP28S3_F3 TaxID=3438939 RepID=UPI003F8A1500
MSSTRYRRGGMYAADMAAYSRAMAEDNSQQMARLKHNLVRALREDVTPRQREFLLLYYGEQLNMRQIGERLGVDKSTVSRTIKRGEARLRRCLRYGAEAFLEQTRS